ncbi:hypothetical protein ACJMK2_025733 [Sinanodonta woodiana]
MLSDVAGESIVRVPLVQKCVYIGQDAKLYKIDKDFANPSFYGENGIFIASWKGTTSILDKMNSSYSRKFKMDKERNIWIFDVKREDAGNYSVIFGAVHGRLVVEIILNVTDKSTEDHECPDFPTEGNSHGTTTAVSKKDFTAGTSHGTTTTGNKKDYTEGSCNSLIIGLLITILFIVMMFSIFLIYIAFILKRLIDVKHWIQETFYSEPMRPKQSFQSHQCTCVPTERTELTKHQVRKWLEGHPDFFENNESLTEFLIKGWLKLHPDFIKKNDDHEDCHQTKTPTVEELGVQVKVPWNEVKAYQTQMESSERKVIASETCSSQNLEPGHENHLQVTPVPVQGTGREDIKKQWMSSQDKVVTYETCSSSNSDAEESFRNNGYISRQHIQKDDKKAAPEGNKAQTDSLDKSVKWMKDPNSDDVSDPLLDKTFNPK